MAAAAMHIGSGPGAEAASSQPASPGDYGFLNRHGVMRPVKPEALAAGAVPSTQLFTRAESGMAPTGTPIQYNVLMIMVDQMRKPRWFPPQLQSEAQFLQAITPNIYHNIYKNGFNFSNYYTAATNCTPARATLLTGLYSQQTCMFQPDSTVYDPTLIPADTSDSMPLTGPQIGFPTFANAISNIDQWATGENLQNYNCAWVGKWHLSAQNTGQSCDLGPYGFGQNAQSLPTNAPGAQFHGITHKVPSPIGWANEGNTGGRLAGQSQYYTSDYDIFYYLDHVWLPNMVANGPDQPPWLCCASFINPHDIASFPSYYGFSSTGSPCIAPPAGSVNACPYGTDSVSCAFINRTQTDISPYHYVPPATSGFDGRNSPTNPQYYPGIAAFSPYVPSNFAAGGSNAIPDWNGFDPLTSYNANGFSGNGTPGKPDFQLEYLKSYQASEGGIVPDCANTSALWQSGWATFMNYYAWMHGCVDSIVGMIFGTGLNATDTPVWGASLGVNQQGQTVTTSTNTMIIFLADHGEYGGSHTMFNKGGAAYDESINVPLYIVYPGQTTPVVIREMVSSVDIMPFLLTTTSLSQSWLKPGLEGPFTYLSGRESLYDMMFEPGYTPMRTVSIIDSFGEPVTLPYVLHTYDETPGTQSGDAQSGPTAAPVPKSHVLCMRTGVGTDSQGNPFGGKIVKYDSWPCNSRIPAAIQRGVYHGQYEFYNYGYGSYVAGGNFYETGNEVYLTNWTPLAGTPSGNFLAGMASIVQQELYHVPLAFVGTSCDGPWYSAFAAYQEVANSSCGAVTCPGPLTTTPWP